MSTATARSTVPKFLRLLSIHGSDFIYHKSLAIIECPCVTPQGFRDDIWHKTDLPDPQLVGIGAGAISGQFEYRLHHLYAQGEKTTPSFGEYTLAANNISFIWFGGMSNPPSGRGPVTGYRLYRRRISAIGPGQSGSWKIAFETNDPTVLTFTDNQADDAALASATPIEMCNPAGMIPADNPLAEFQAKGFIQPVQSGAVRKLTTEALTQLFGEIQTDDHLGILPVFWNHHHLNFSSWGESLEDWIVYLDPVNGDRKFTVVSANLIPDPADGNPSHHWEVGLRLI